MAVYPGFVQGFFYAGDHFQIHEIGVKHEDFLCFVFLCIVEGI